MCKNSEKFTIIVPIRDYFLVLLRSLCHDVSCQNSQDSQPFQRLRAEESAEDTCFLASLLVCDSSFS